MVVIKSAFLASLLVAIVAAGPAPRSNMVTFPYSIRSSIHVLPAVHGTVRAEVKTDLAGMRGSRCTSWDALLTADAAAATTIVAVDTSLPEVGSEVIAGLPQHSAKARDTTFFVNITPDSQAGTRVRRRDCYLYKDAAA
ncbi:hypothetical protein FIBSPDRAFT_940969 [Athelia psychrophila]|uniref:Uncharacterized protein n=1 Tax=Athelia psychrophila TaxID=1759441 RepID=A0A167UZP1_9AGAM|nr:hypothetical protein FIBSPDRAFT_940969 [Fibularhizoctonia sp. CBS 109695]